MSAVANADVPCSALAQGWLAADNWPLDGGPPHALQMQTSAGTSFKQGVTPESGDPLSDLLRKQFTRPQPNLIGQVFSGALWAAVALASKVALQPFTGDFAPFLTFFPVVMAAGILSGGLAGPTALILTGLAALAFTLIEGVLPPVQIGTSLISYLVSGAAMLWITGQLRSALSELSAARAQEELMLGELQHRVKNTLAIVQAIATQTLRSKGSPVELRRQLIERLVALSEAHNLLSETGWRDASLRALVDRTLKPFVGSHSARVSFVGAHDVQLPAEHVVNVAMSLHELATNATKYGAWSVPEGRVKVSLSVREVRKQAGLLRVQLEWLEEGGPEVVEPQATGFGSRILRQIPTGQSGASASIEYAPGGVRWSVGFDLPFSVR